MRPNVTFLAGVFRIICTETSYSTSICFPSRCTRCVSCMLKTLVISFLTEVSTRNGMVQLACESVEECCTLTCLLTCKCRCLRSSLRHETHLHEIRYVLMLSCLLFIAHAHCSDWQIWTSAISTTTAVRDLFISSVRKYAADGQSSQPLGDWYETTTGAVEGFRARPVVGGHLALVGSSV